MVQVAEGVFESLSPDEGGTIRSEVFPGLWSNIPAFWEHDLAQLTAVFQQGLVTPEHADFVDQLIKREQ